jgi:hypothetical protein
MKQYTNHVILRGLDEARAHQRGEAVGKAVVVVPPRKTAKKERAQLVRPTGVTKEQPTRGRKPWFNLAKQKEIADQEGKVADLAEFYGCPITVIYRIRRLRREGVL